MTTWVLEHDVFSDGDEALSAAVQSAGARVLAWKDDWWITGRWPKLLGERVVFHGSLANADRIARELPWSPGAFCSTSRFECSAWWPSLAARLVSPTRVITTVAALVSDGPPPEFGDRVFVRPDSPLKPFSGRVLGRGDITLASLDHGYYYDDEALPIVVTPAVTIGSEWRFVVVADRVVAGSAYTADGRSAGSAVSTTSPAWRYAAEVVAEVIPPDPVFIVDVCEVGGEVRVLEMNPFSGADLYGCDRQAVVDAVQDLLD
ncbi:MAG: ATP-grasp domain-containing protein [Propionibacteriaceae bacterium]|nr:ATP-grasp domain-containing protein [Micropruina sp.]HBX79666.1 DUF4343 domain-containing protein [Propionibacteriaceae bacterium]HBY23712.1 DUF4343 domain-containing protein [Propionibacteriaceae bacterium]